MITALLPLGGLAVVAKTINELADKELELQAKYAECVAKNPDLSKLPKCKPKTPALAKAVLGISTLVMFAGFAFLLHKGDK